MQGDRSKNGSLESSSQMEVEAEWAWAAWAEWEKVMGQAAAREMATVAEHLLPVPAVLAKVADRVKVEVDLRVG